MEDKNNFAIIAMVAVVAIVGIVGLIMSMNNGKTSLNDDASGQAAKVFENVNNINPTDDTPPPSQCSDTTRESTCVRYSNCKWANGACTQKYALSN